MKKIERNLSFRPQGLKDRYIPYKQGGGKMRKVETWEDVERKRGVSIPAWETRFRNELMRDHTLSDVAIQERIEAERKLRTGKKGGGNND